MEVAAWMAGLGADVVKVEPLRGDPVRGVIRQPEVDPTSPRPLGAFAEATTCGIDLARQHIMQRWRSGSFS